MDSNNEYKPVNYAGSLITADPLDAERSIDYGLFFTKLLNKNNIKFEKPFTRANVFKIGNNYTYFTGSTKGWWGISQNVTNRIKEKAKENNSNSYVLFYYDYRSFKDNKWFCLNLSKCDININRVHFNINEGKLPLPNGVTSHNNTDVLEPLNSQLIIDNLKEIRS